TQLHNHYLGVKLDGAGPNRFAIGAAVTVWSGGRPQLEEENPTRGYQSNVDFLLSFGVGGRDTLDSLEVDWPDGRVTRRTHVATNQRLTLRQADAVAHPPLRRPRPPLFTDVTDEVGGGADARRRRP